MKTRSLLFAGIVTGLLSSPAWATSVELFHESFDGNNQKWSYTSTGARSYDRVWTEEAVVKPGYKGVKLGSTGDYGAIISEAIEVRNTVSPVSVTIVAAAYQNGGGGKEGILLTVYDSSDNAVFSDYVVELTQHTSTDKDEIPATAAYTHEFTIPANCLPSDKRISLRIECTWTKTGQRRILLGDVLLTQDNITPTASPSSASVNATVGVASSIDLSDYFSDADGDALTYAVASGVGTVSGSTWTYTPAAAGSYSAVVSATDPYGASATMSIAVTAEEPQLPILDTPTGLVDSNVSFTSFGLSWNAVSGADGYVVTLSPADGSVVVSGTSATASGLTEGTTYTVNVVATGAGAIDSAAASLEVQTLVHVQLAAPAGLASSSVTDSGFTLSWSAVANAANYSVSVLDGNDAAAGTVSVSGTTATVTGLSADTAYTAKVQALKPSGDTPYLDSEWSDTVSVTTELADGLKRAILFNETFDKVAGAGWQYSGNIQNTDETGWSFGTDTVRGPKGIRLGTSNNPSSATTREIAVSNALDSTEVVISFLAAAYSGKTSAGTLTLIDAATDGETVLTNLTPAAMSNGTGDPLAGGTSYEVAASVPSRFKLRFESLSTASDKRLLLDSIKVTQVYDPNIQTVGAPTVSVSGETTSGFTVSWTDADENAESYDLMVTSAGGTTTNLSVSGVMSPYAVSGLAAGTVYTAFVRAVGDNLHFAPSAWASASAETEALSYDVEFSVDGSAEGPFSRTVRAGNAVSFTVAAALVSNGGTSEDVTGSISTDFPSGSFNPATGAFSWTPSEADVGTTNIGFSVTANGVAFTETVAVTVLSNYRDEPLFRETFTNVGNYSWSATTDLAFPTRTTASDNDLWSGTNCIAANYAIRLGKASEFGHATTPVIETKGSGQAELTLAFRCARTAGSGRVAVTVAALSGQTIYAVTNTPVSATVSGHNAIGAEHGMTNSFAFAAGGAFTVTFTPVGDGRVGIDEIEVFQKVPAASEAVALETVHSSATSDAKANGFTATWGAVDNAEGYAVMVFDRNGAYVPGATATVDSANCRAVITGLSPSSRYYVKIKALGDGSATWDSVWSAASLADTTNPPTVISVW